MAEREALDLANQQHDKTVQGRVLLALGNLYRDSREYQLAEKHYRQAEELAELCADMPLQGSVYIGWGNLYFKQGRLQDTTPSQDAQPYDEKARKLVQQDYEKAVKLVLQNLELGREKYEKALKFAIQARDPRLQGTVLHMLGSTYRRLGNPNRALELLQQSVSMADACPSEVGLAGRLNDLGTVDQDLGLFEQAREHYQQAVRIYRKHDVASPDVAGCLENLGGILVRLGDISAGRDYILDASIMDNMMIAEAFAIASEDARLDFLRQAQGRLNDLVSLVARGGPLDGDSSMVRACTDVVIRRKGVTLEALAAQRDIAASGSHPELAGNLQELATVRMEMAQLILAGRGLRRDGSFTPQAADLEDRKRRLEQLVGQYLPHVALDEQLRRVDREVIAWNLPKGSVLVEFLRFDFFAFPPPDQEARWSSARYAAFVLPAGAPDKVQIIDLGEAEPIDRMIAVFRASITGEDGSRSSRDLGALPVEPEQAPDISDGSALREAIFDPLLV